MLLDPNKETIFIIELDKLHKIANQNQEKINREYSVKQNREYVTLEKLFQTSSQKFDLESFCVNIYLAYRTRIGRAELLTTFNAIN